MSGANRPLAALLWLALAAGLAASACATAQPIPVDAGFWQQKGMRVGVVVSPVPKASAYKAGAQGLLDIAINSAMASDLQKMLEARQSAAIARAGDQFEGRLQSLGFVTLRIAQPIDFTKLPERKDPPENVFGRDIGPLAEAHGVDAILLLDVMRWGTVRNYYGFVPLGPPQGMYEVAGLLIGRDGRIRWRANNLSQPPVDVQGEWDQGPNFPNLGQALSAAEQRAAAFLEKDFFGTVAPTATPAAIAATPPQPPAAPLSPAPNTTTAPAAATGPTATTAPAAEVPSAPVPTPVPAAAPAAITSPVATTPAPGAPSLLVAQPAAESHRSMARTAGYVVGGLGIAALGVGAYFGARAITLANDVERDCPMGQCTANAVALNEDAKSAARVADFVIGGGVLSVGIATILILTSDDAGEKPAPRYATLRPSLSPTSVGALVGASF